MVTQLFHHLKTAGKAAHFAFRRSLKENGTFDEIVGLTDALTGISNNNAFIYDRNTFPAFHTLLLIDIDNMKQINDTFGHLFGDQILKNCAEILSHATHKVGKSYRLYSDVFASVVPYYSVKKVCLSIKNAIKEDSRFTISIGISRTCDTPGLTDTVFKSAETSLYLSKNHDPDIYTQFLTEVHIALPVPPDIYMEELYPESMASTL